ncbi:hypothetical protein V3C99_010502 [Haemonchus contortus]
MDEPGSSESSQTQPGKIETSPFGFPEKDVIFFINSCGLSEDEARDFMLFLTFANQMNEKDEEVDYTIIRATAMVNLVSKLNTESKKILSGGHIAKALEHVSTENLSHVHPSALQPPNVSPPNAKVKGFRPTFARHNDVKYYPNIICVICKEWVCSRSRRIHVGAHFDYRKHKCSFCNFTHSKEIFIASHMRRIHGREGKVELHSDPEIEEKIENVCNLSIAMTRDVLRGQYDEKIYESYSNSHTPRCQIPNRERRSRTQVLKTVTDATNMPLLF